MMLDFDGQMEVVAERDRLRVENERLRAVLELIAQSANSDDWSREVARKVQGWYHE